MPRSSYVPEASTDILLVSSNSVARAAVTQWLKSEAVNVEVAESSREAIKMMHDLLLVGGTLDGLLVDAEVADGYGFRVIREFRHEFPGLATALLTDVENDISLGVWSKSKQIPVLRKPVERPALLNWLEQTKLSYRVTNVD